MSAERAKSLSLIIERNFHTRLPLFNKFPKCNVCSTCASLLS